jgi:hypothetical protein
MEQLHSLIPLVDGFSKHVRNTRVLFLHCFAHQFSRTYLPLFAVAATFGYHLYRTSTYSMLLLEIKKSRSGSERIIVFGSWAKSINCCWREDRAQGLATRRGREYNDEMEGEIINIYRTLACPNNIFVCFEGSVCGWLWSFLRRSRTLSTVMGWPWDFFFRDHNSFFNNASVLHVCICYTGVRENENNIKQNLFTVWISDADRSFYNIITFRRFSGQTTIFSQIFLLHGQKNLA